MKPVTLLLLLAPMLAAQTPSRDEMLRAMRKGAEFYRDSVATEGGYHYYYASDLSYGRSEHGEGPTQIEVQREATPIVGMAYLEAYEATRDRFYLECARAAAHALVRGQLCSGGWDYLIEFDPEKRKQYQYRSDGNCAGERGVTNLDDNVTQGALRLMMRVDKALGFSDEKIHEATLFALDKLIAAQYPIGAWPQRFREPPDFSKFPVKRASYPESWSKQWPGPNYQSHYTLNDNTIPDAIDMMLEAARIYKEPRYLASAEKGGQFLLLAQMPDPQPAWAQQYDANMHPAWARIFEPPSVTGGESRAAMRALMVLYRETGDRKYLEPIPRALAYLKRSFVPRTDAAVFRRVPAGEPVLARFYELKTNRPLYITKGTRMNAAGLGSRLVDGYQISYEPDSVITHYGVIGSGREIADLEADYEQLAAADPKSLRRPDDLRGLSPWAERQRPQPQASGLASEARRLIESMDSRGAWVKEGTIGKADRLVFVYSARDMVLRVGRGPSDGAAGGRRSEARVIPLKEDDTVEIFMGSEPPRQQIISSEDFARNLVKLAEAVRTMR
ncbi:MAG: pectate lyase [Bryobacteraceae bacterium]